MFISERLIGFIPLCFSIFLLSRGNLLAPAAEISGTSAKLFEFRTKKTSLVVICTEKLG